MIKKNRTLTTILACSILMAVAGCGESALEKRHDWYLDSKFDYFELDMIARAIPEYAISVGQAPSEPVSIQLLAEKAFIKTILAESGVRGYAVMLTDKELVIHDSKGVVLDKVPLNSPELFAATEFDFVLRK